MSVSTINATTGSMAAAGAIIQAQAVQYANHFAALQAAIASGDLSEARRAFDVFQRDSAVASSNGYNPVAQTEALRQDFSALKKALNIGDIRSAKAAFSALKHEMGTPQGNSGTAQSSEATAAAALKAMDSAISSGNTPVAKKALAVFGKEVALSASAGAQTTAPLTSGSKVIQDIRSLQVVLSSGDAKKISATFIKMRQELTSFAQSPLVFPTSDAGIAKLSVISSTQAELQGISTTMPGAQPNQDNGTPSAPTPELLLGSRGMTIPPGADIRFAGAPILLKGLALPN